MEFDGRLTEDFKLGTGTWISVGPLRARINSACAPLLHDAVITGQGRDELGALLFLSPAGCKELAPDAVHARLREAFGKLARESTGSSNRITRVLVLTEPPSIDVGEITDKGSINQREVLARRAALVERLYAPDPDPEIIVVKP
jgi:feruloyl-CoA synthase